MIRLLLKHEKERLIRKAELPKTSDNIRWLRFIVYGYAIGCLGGLVVFASDLMRSPTVSTINILSISYFFLFFFAIFYHTITQKSFENEEKQKEVAIPGIEMLDLMNKIDQIVMEKKMFLEPDLNLQKLASVLQEKDRNISQAINTVKKRNVNDYINSFRIEFACNLLLTNKEKPIFEVMYKSGFSTKAAFNLAFKKMTGETPTQYKSGKVNN